MTVRHIALGFLFLNNFILRTSEFILKGSKTLNHKIQSMTILVTLVKGLWGKRTEKKGITKIHCWVCKIHLTWTYSGGGERRKGISGHLGWMSYLLKLPLSDPCVCTNVTVPLQADILPQACILLLPLLHWKKGNLTLCNCPFLYV